MKDAQSLASTNQRIQDGNLAEPIQLSAGQTNSWPRDSVEADSGRANSGSTPVQNDGIDRRNFLSCMAWAGTGLLWTMAGGVPTSKLFAASTGSTGGQMGQSHGG